MTDEEKQDLIDYFKNTSPRVRTLSNRDRDIFLEMLNADDEPNEALKRAVETHRKLIKQPDPETIEAIKEGIASFERGEGRPAKQTLEEIAEKYGIKDKNI